eukprot:scaffold27008_cov67-Phaeocystis_antarctica.AAC.7
MPRRRGDGERRAACSRVVHEGDEPALILCRLATPHHAAVVSREEHRLRYHAPLAGIPLQRSACLEVGLDHRAEGEPAFRPRRASKIAVAGAFAVAQRVEGRHIDWHGLAARRDCERHGLAAHHLL